MRKPPLPQACASLKTAGFPIMLMGIMVENAEGEVSESQTEPVSAGSTTLRGMPVTLCDIV